MKKEKLTEEIVVNENLFFLSTLLFTLDNLEFDKEVRELLNNLTFLVEKKLFENFKIDKDICNRDLKIKFYYEN